MERYDVLLDDRPREGGAFDRSQATVPILFRYPSALREKNAVTRDVLARRREMADDELRALKAAAPVPAPVDRPDRLRMQALAEGQWLGRELRALRRAGKGRSPSTAEALYYDTRPQDPLPDAASLLGPIRSVGRGKLVNLAFQVAETRYGVSRLGEWLITMPPSIGAGPVNAGLASELPPGCGRRVMVDDRPVAVFRVGEEVFAVGAICPHRGGGLDEGDIEDGAVLCPLHGWAFDLKTGAQRDRPLVTVPTYRVEVRSGEIWIHPREEGR